MEVLLLVLRVLHIAGGVVWVGAVIVAVFFIEPAASDLRKEGERFLAHLIARRRLTDAMAVAAVVTIVAGLALYWIDSNGFTSAWMTTPAGLAFGAGGISAILAFLVAAVYLKPAFDRLAAGAAPHSGAAAARLRQASLAQAGLLAFTVVTMAIARYL